MSARLPGRYHQVQELGQGGMGQVFLVQDLVAKRQVALKIVHATGAKSRLQLEHEFRVMTQLRHANCCEVYDFGSLADGAPYFTMEVVPGVGLDELVDRRPATIRAVLIQLLAALGYLHRQGYVHRDVKAENVRIRADGVVKLMDYGLLEHAGRAGLEVAGTASTMAPETIRREVVDQRADLYAVGCLAYELLAGRPPFEANELLGVLRAHLDDVPRPPSRFRPGVDPELEAVALKLLAKDPLARYQDAQDAIEALGGTREGGEQLRLLPSPMVGREAELALLVSRRDGLARSAVVGLYGPAGIGKSRLVEAFRQDTQVHDLGFFAGAAYEQGTLPYGPFVEILRRAMPTLRERHPSLVAELAPVLVRLLPELEADPAPELDMPSKEKARLRLALADLLGALATGGPLVLVLDDWQWADVSSVQVLGELRQTLAQSPIFWLIAARERPAEPPLDEAIEVAPLDAPALARLAATALGMERAPAGLDALVARQAGGNPNHARALLEHLIREGLLRRPGARWELAPEAESAALPGNLWDLFRARLDALAPGARRLAAATAVLGDHASYDRLVTVTGLETEALGEAREQLIAAGVVLPTAQGTLAFTQEEYLTLVDARLGPEERRALHAAAHHAIARDTGEAVPDLAALTALARHAIAGGLEAETVRWALEAGKQHAALFNRDQAERFLAAGLELLPAGGTRRAERLAYLMALASHLRVVSAHVEADPLLTEAVELAEALGKPDLLAEAATGLGRSLLVRGEIQRALTAFDRAYAGFRAANNPGGLSHAATGKSRALYFRGDLSQAKADATLALEAARESGSSQRLGQALAWIGYLEASHDPVGLADGIAHMEEARQLQEAANDLIALANTLSLLSNVLIVTGDLPRARVLLDRQEEITRALGNLADFRASVVAMAEVALQLGEPDEAIARARQAVAICDRLGSHYARGPAVAAEAAALAHLGQLDAAARRIVDATAIQASHGMPYEDTAVAPYRVAVGLLLGQVAEVDAGIARLRELAAGGEVDQVLALELALAGQALAAGDAEAAAAAAKRARDAAEPGRRRKVLVEAGKLSAQAALLAGQPGEALKTARATLAEAREAGFRRLVVELLLAEGQAVLEVAGAGADAATPFERARELATALADPLLAALAGFGLAKANQSLATAEGARQELNQLLRRQDPAVAAALLTRRDVQAVQAGYTPPPSRPQGRWLGASSNPSGSLAE